MDLLDEFQVLMRDSINLLLVRDQLPELSEQVIGHYYELVGVRSWYLVSDAWRLNEDLLMSYFTARYEQLRRQLNVLSVIYEFEHIDIEPRCEAICA